MRPDRCEDMEDMEDDTPDWIPDLIEPWPIAELRNIKENTKEVLTSHRAILRQIKKDLRQVQTKLRRLRKNTADQKNIAIVEHTIRTLEERAETVAHAIEKFVEQEKMNNAKLKWMAL